MTTNLLSLPQFPAGTSITISSNADFNDQFFIGVPNFQSSPITIIGNLTTGTYVIAGIISTVGLVPGMAVTGFGISAGTIIASGGVGATTLTLNNIVTATVSGLQITILPPPLDLTGISFSSMFRTNATTSTVLIQMTTQNLLMVNGAQAGTFGWNVPAAKLPGLLGLSATGKLSLVIGVHATDTTGAVIDLCAENGPLPVTVNLSATS